jgi:hypothetical protein
MLEQRIVSSAHGYVGNWSWSRATVLSGVPHRTDWVAVEGTASEPVKDVTFVSESGECSVVVQLEPIKTDDPELVQELVAIRLRDGWERHGGPWKGQ